ncbi:MULTISPECIES: S1C family serine protease [Streptococcus]|uniref:S1C family serine protease n=1 Tax=Streptococcus caledonicus TaxID=2614158 RepID=A0ABW0UFZ8_9STRE|nr:trypsin-like peptidase domain-containing protein [Streptococcus sp. S784/96/1]
MKKNLSFILKFILLVGSGFLGGVVATFLILQNNFVLSKLSGNSSPTTSISNVSYKNTSDTTSAVASVQDAVVSVINYQRQQNNSLQNIFDNSTSSELTVASEGSGVIYKKDDKSAYVVTNNHVIEGAQQIEILFSDGSKVVGELIGSDTYSDLAVVKISSDNVKTIATFANSETLTVGETAIAIGSPLGSEYANSVTEGIVSSLSRTVTMKNEQGQTTSTNAIQTDAAINPGNSGGALINIQGQVIGINSSKISSISTSRLNGSSVEGMGFAIPSNDVVKIINQLEKNGKVNRPALGITMASLSELSTNFIFQLKLPEEVTSGIVIASVQNNMPASGKLEKYDVITKIDDKSVASPSDVQSILYGHSTGDAITVTFYREGKKQTIDIILDKTTQDLNSN